MAIKGHFESVISVVITITIVRGTLATESVIYSATSTNDFGHLAPQIITFPAKDFNPPLLLQLTYTAFIGTSLVPVIRVGPENFDWFIVSD